MQIPDALEQRQTRPPARRKRTNKAIVKHQRKRFQRSKRKLAAAERHQQKATGLYLAVNTFQVIGLKGLQVSLLVKQIIWAAYSNGRDPPGGDPPGETPPLSLCLGVAEVKKVM